MARHPLTDAQWGLIADIFPEPAATGRPPVKPRDMIDGILWRLRRGSPWRDLPEEFGPWKTVYNHFNKWNSDGTLYEVKRHFLQRIVDDDGVDTDLWCVDGTVVRAARCAAGGGKKGTLEPDDHASGRSQGFSTQIHLICDVVGCPIHFEISAGQAH